MPDQLEYISNENSDQYQMDDLIGIPPNWLMRSGISIVFIVVAVIAVFSAFIKYPDKITANGIMTSENPPIDHVNISSGIIEEVFIDNGSVVEEGQKLLYIKNNTKRDDLSALKSFITSYFAVTSSQDFLTLQFPKNLQLGEIHAEYNQLSLLYSEFKETLQHSGVLKQINTLSNEIEQIKSLRNILTKEKKYSREELDLKEKDYKRHLKLNEDGAVSDLNREKVEAEWLRHQKEYGNLDQRIIQNKIREEQLILDRHQLIEERNLKIRSQRSDVERTLNSLLSRIDDWERRYYVKAEISGEVSFVSPLIKDKYITQNTNVLSIIPTENSNTKQIQVKVSNDGIGKINNEDKVIIRVNGYPYKEFGTLTSAVNSISELPEILQNANGETTYLYTIKVLLPSKLLTNHKKEIMFKPNSVVTADIITKDKSILERLFETLISNIKSE